MPGPGVWGGGDLVFNGDSTLVGDETVLEMDGGHGGIGGRMYVIPQSSRLKHDQNGKFYVMYVLPQFLKTEEKIKDKK